MDGGRGHDDGGVGGDRGQLDRWCRRATRETKRIAWRRDGDGRLGLDHVLVGKGDKLQATVGAARHLNGAVERRHVPQPLARVGPAPKAAKPGGRHSGRLTHALLEFSSERERGGRKEEERETLGIK